MPHLQKAAVFWPKRHAAFPRTQSSHKPRLVYFRVCLLAGLYVLFVSFCVGRVCRVCIFSIRACFDLFV